MLTLNDGRSELWQWDTKRKLTVDADCTQVHFSNKVFGRSIDVDVVDGVAIIPDVLLQTDKELTAWAFVGTPENGYTKISKVFKVNRRNKPADYVFTPTNQTTLEELVERLEKIEKNQDPDAINKAVDDYLASNPIKIDETDPTVPEWAKQSTKPAYTAQEVGALPNTTIIPTVPTTLPNPYKLTFTGAVVAEYDGGKEVTVEIPEGGGSADAVLYTAQELTEEQKEQARENIGAMPADAVIALSKVQANALDALFKAASYIKDVSAEYAAFCDAFGLVNPDEPDEPDDSIPAIKQGTVSFGDGKMGLNGTIMSRATLIPIGQYLEKGVCYKFSLGDAASNYMYGVQICVADSPALEFPHTYGIIDYDGVPERLVDSGWITTDYAYTPNRDNCILVVNFKLNSEISMDDSNYAEILENFTIDKVVEPDVLGVKTGMVTTTNSRMTLDTNRVEIATRIPIGQYLKKGKTYKFSISNIATKYVYAVRIFAAFSAELIFPYSANSMTYGGVTDQIFMSNWMTTDYTYTPDRDNCILAVNFKLNSGASMDDSNYTEILENFVFEEVV